MHVQNEGGGGQRLFEQHKKVHFSFTSILITQYLYLHLVSTLKEEKYVFLLQRDFEKLKVRRDLRRARES